MASSQKDILIVEDDEALKNMLVLVFEDENYQVDVAINGQDAWSLINKNHYDLLTTDLYMPKMNGVDLILKCQTSFPALKTIVLCGGGKDLTASHGGKLVKLLDQEVSVDSFLRKPCDLNELLSTVERLLQE